MHKITFDRLVKLFTDNKIQPVTLAAHSLKEGGQVYTDAEAPAVGDAIYSDAEMSAPVADGTYSLESGVTIIVAGGKIAEMVEADNMEAEAEEMVAALAQTIETLKADTVAKAAEITALKAEVAKFGKQVTELTAAKVAVELKLSAIKPDSVRNVTETTTQVNNEFKFRNAGEGYEKRFGKILTSLQTQSQN